MKEKVVKRKQEMENQRRERRKIWESEGQKKNKGGETLEDGAM